MRASSRSLSLDPVELLTYQGIWELVDSRIVAVVGTRNPTGEGVRNTDALVRHLVTSGFTIASGLAAGIDTAAHRAAIDAGGHTIAVIGTPLGESYPRENAELQAKLAREHLVVSQVPIEKYARQTWRENRLFFPARNVTMSALSEATIIVEAGPSSGTLIQARAALAQRRPLFILASCFDRPELTWPRELEQQGAVRLDHFEQLRDALAAPL
ncbi:MAG: DNA-processing protein DprA [Nannocystaceae bacterium]